MHCGGEAFWKDLQSVRKLMSALKTKWSKTETFCINHYPGKELVKNILVLQFANIALGSAWDNHRVSNVQITFKAPFSTAGSGLEYSHYGVACVFLH